MYQHGHLLNRFFWGVNVFTWLSIHVLFTHIQYGAVLGTEKQQTWLKTWLYLSPWFLLWILVTAGIFGLVLSNRDRGKTLWGKICSHFVWMSALLLCYWLLANVGRILVRQGDMSELGYFFLRTLRTSSQLDILIYLGVLAIALALRFYHDSIQERIELKRLHSELVQEQLRTLRSQLNPHFLFNALNTIASLVRLKREKDAVTALSELSMMLRKILENKNNSDIKIRDEIAFIQSYLAIQKMRFDDKLDSRIVVQQDCLELAIPNMLLHPLVENAVQHGSQLESNKNPLDLRVGREGEMLLFQLTNRVSHSEKHKGFGIGLENTRSRLSKLYSVFQLELRQIDDELIETRMAIPIGELNA